MKTTSTSPKAIESRKRALDLIQQAQGLLLDALHAASPLQGWAELKPRGPYYLIEDHYDATRELWHKVNNAPVPTGHDYEDSPPPPPAGESTPEGSPVASLSATDPFEAEAHI